MWSFQTGFTVIQTADDVLDIRYDYLCGFV